jgi:hypothetical protein
MRLWSLHPKYLDTRGLVACWREGLLARNVLEGNTRGYRNHPQLQRFRDGGDAIRLIDAYLQALVDEAEARGYKFDRTKLGPAPDGVTLDVTEEQILYEFGHLRAKLAVRDPARLQQIAGIDMPQAHPLFRVVPGGVENWERKG